MQKDEMISRIEERISAWTFLPRGVTNVMLLYLTKFIDYCLWFISYMYLMLLLNVSDDLENSHPMNIMHFGPEDNKQAYDFFGNESKLLPTEQIMATVLFYLSNVSQGGQILFPESDDSQSLNSHVRNLIWSDCTRSSNVMRPTKGNAILFFNLHLSASPDRTSSHSRCPVLEGEMWCAAKFFSIKAVAPLKVNLQVDNSDCTDEDESCPKWAEIGECERNPVFMIGSPDYYGTCRKSCNAC